MTTGPDASPRATRCGAPTEITASQLATLNALPNPVEPPSPRLSCELADGHQDAHLAFALASHGGEQSWWLRWGWRHEVVEIDHCDATEPEGPDPEFCLFPGGHPGSHSFELQPWSGRDVSDGLLRAAIADVPPASAPAHDTAGPGAASVGPHGRMGGNAVTPSAARDLIAAVAEAIIGADGLVDLIDACQSYISGQLMLLIALRNGADPQAVHPKAQAELDQLIAAVDHASAERPLQNRRCDPGE